MQHWKLHEIDTPNGARSPVVLHSREGERRIVLIALGGGEQLGDHTVKESAALLVLDGSVRVESGDESVDASAGELFHFEPNERHSVSSEAGARLLLFLAPWPGEGHYRGDAAASVSAS